MMVTIIKCITNTKVIGIDCSQQSLNLQKNRRHTISKIENTIYIIK